MMGDNIEKRATLDEDSQDDDGVNSTAAHLQFEGRTESFEVDCGKGDRSDNKLTVVTHNERWEDAFNRLKAFQKRHGHCEVPFRYAPDTRLGRWVAFQRTMYRRRREGKGDTVSLTQDRIRRLEAIGFEWSVRGGKLSPWELRFNDLVNFKRRFRHCRVPADWQENQELGVWVKEQRMEATRLRNGRSSRLTEEQHRRLTDIGFEWEGVQPQSSPRPPSDANAGSMTDLAHLQLRRHFATSHQHSSAPYLPTPLSNHLFQTQLDLLLAQNRSLPTSIPGFFASEAAAEASRREGLLRQAMARRTESQNLFSGHFASPVPLGQPSVISSLSTLASQNTLLERLVVQQALQDIRGLSAASQTTPQALPFSSPSLYSPQQFAPSNQVQTSFLDTRRTSNLLNQGPLLRTAVGLTSHAGAASTLRTTAEGRGVEGSEVRGKNGDESKGL